MPKNYHISMNISVCKYRDDILAPAGTEVTKMSVEVQFWINLFNFFNKLLEKLLSAKMYSFNIFPITISPSVKIQDRYFKFF